MATELVTRQAIVARITDRKALLKSMRVLGLGQSEIGSALVNQYELELDWLRGLRATYLDEQGVRAPLELTVKFTPAKLDMTDAQGERFKKLLHDELQDWLPEVSDHIEVRDQSPTRPRLLITHKGGPSITKEVMGVFDRTYREGAWK